MTGRGGASRIPATRVRQHRCGSDLNHGWQLAGPSGARLPGVSHTQCLLVHCLLFPLRGVADKIKEKSKSLGSWMSLAFDFTSGCKADKDRWKQKVNWGERKDWKMVLFSVQKPSPPCQRRNGHRAVVESRATVPLAAQTEHLPRPLCSHGHTDQCFSLITPPHDLEKKLWSSEAALYGFVRKNQITYTITKTSKATNLPLPTSLSH